MHFDQVFGDSKSQPGSWLSTDIGVVSAVEFGESLAPEKITDLSPVKLVIALDSASLAVTVIA